MKDLIKYIATSLVDDPAAVDVSVRQQHGETHIELTVAEEDMGRVIGRGGRVANAMRNLLRVAASRRGSRATLDIV
ncbi:MAG: KH domain-containing protein [Anaerolineales bacterium]|nr:KH domain-containing protein [Anaerolineales bacterium]